MKEDKDTVRHEDVVENFGGDESSSDENVDYNLIAGGTLYLVVADPTLVLVAIFWFLLIALFVNDFFILTSMAINFKKSYLYT